MAQKRTNIFLRLHPLHRLGISVALAGIVFGLLPGSGLPVLLKYVAAWNVFCLSEVCTSWIVFFTRSTQDIRKLAQEEDGSRWAVIAFVLLGCFAGFLNVGLLLIGSKGEVHHAILSLILGFLGMLFSWFLVHTLFAFHYARYYYAEDVKGGLEFPGESNPDYLDFAYFSFVIGMTFQVSDIEISSSKIRRLALFHGLLAFCLNTFVVALTVNTIAGIEI